MADAFAEGGIEVALDFKNSRQAMPTNGPNKFFDAGAPTGDDDAFQETDNDDEATERQTMPSGEAGGTRSNMDLGSVAPYKYSDFGKWPNPVSTKYVLGNVPD